jgi:hypothetical protein
MKRRLNKKNAPAARPRRSSTALIRKTDNRQLSKAQVKSFPEEAKEIRKLHDAVLGHASLMLEQAIEIGGRLVKVKEGLEHGYWLPWLEANVRFTEPTAANYMRCFENRDVLEAAVKVKTVLTLTDAYRLIAGTGQHPKRRKPDADQAQPESPPEENDIPSSEIDSDEAGSTATPPREETPDKVFGRTRDQIFGWFGQRVKNYFNVMSDRELIPAQVAVLKALLDDEELGGEPVLKYPDETERSLREQLGRGGAA